jgi:hypothetical protein
MSDQDDATIRVVFDVDELPSLPRGVDMRRAARGVEQRRTAYERTESHGRAQLSRLARQLARPAIGGMLSDVGGLFASPLTGAMAAIAAVGVVSTRLVTGKPLAGTGEELNQMILGDRDDKARAYRRTREWIESHEDAMIAIGREGFVPSDIRDVALDYFQREFVKEKGLSALRTAFPTPTLVDMLVERTAGAWEGTIKPALQSFVDALALAPIAFTG